MSQSLQRSKPTLRKQCLRALLFSSALYLLACVGCASFQRQLIYFPPRLTSEQAYEFATSERLELWKSPSGKSLGWKRLSPTQPAQGQALILHGNACGAFQCAHYADAIQQAASFDVFILEYPGYGDRPGSPSEAALQKSAAEALGLLGTNAPVYCVGESLGTGVAAYLAGHYPERSPGSFCSRLSAGSPTSPRPTCQSSRCVGCSGNGFPPKMICATIGARWPC